MGDTTEVAIGTNQTGNNGSSLRDVALTGGYKFFLNEANYNYKGEGLGTMTLQPEVKLGYREVAGMDSNGMLKYDKGYGFLALGGKLALNEGGDCYSGLTGHISGHKDLNTIGHDLSARLGYRIGNNFDISAGAEQTLSSLTGAFAGSGNIKNTFAGLYASVGTGISNFTHINIGLKGGFNNESGPSAVANNQWKPSFGAFASFGF